MGLHFLLCLPPLPHCLSVRSALFKKSQEKITDYGQRRMPLLAVQGEHPPVLPSKLITILCEEPWACNTLLEAPPTFDVSAIHDKKAIFLYHPPSDVANWSLHVAAAIGNIVMMEILVRVSGLFCNKFETVKVSARI
jgi:hypothetical protein